MGASSLSGKVVWVTGASSGIGESLCHELARQGARVVLSARREEVLRTIQEALPRPDEHLVLPLDVCETDQFPAAVDQVLTRFGHVDVLLHCAGVSQRGTALETHLSVDRHLVALNYIGPVALSKQVLPSMIERRAGHIVVVSSLLGKFSVPGRAAYCGSKHALHGFFNSLRGEVYDFNIAVTIVCPGFIRTNAWRNALRGDGKLNEKPDEGILHGMAADECARQILKAISRKRSEINVGGKERFATLLYRLSPRIFNRFIRRVKLD